MSPLPTSVKAFQTILTNYKWTLSGMLATAKALRSILGAFLILPVISAYFSLHHFASDFLLVSGQSNPPAVKSLVAAVDHKPAPIQRLSYFRLSRHDIAKISISEGQCNLAETEANFIAIREAILRCSDIVLVHEAAIGAPQVQQKVLVV